MKKNVARILTAVLMLSVIFSSSVFAAEKQQSAWESFVGLFSGSATAAEDTQIDGITYRTHIQNDGWAQGWVSDGTTSGSEGRGLRLEGIEIKIDGDNLPDGLGVTYRTQIENDGWLDWETDGDTSGSVGKGLRLEAIEIKLTGDDAGDYSVGYKTHVQNYGWEKDWSYNGDTSGTVGEGLRLEGIQIEIFKNIPDLTEYEAALAAVTQADYTAASWTTYQAVVAANVVTEDNLVSEVEEATAAITAAQANLVKVLKVESVSAINANQFKVVFNKEVDKNTAETPANYTLKVNGSTVTPANWKAQLLDDKKSVILSNSTGTPYASNTVILASGNSYQLIVEKVLDTTYNPVTKFTSTVAAFIDTTAPVITKAEYKDGKVKIYFNKPVNNTGATYKVDGSATSAVPTSIINKEVYNLEFTPNNDQKTVGDHVVTLYSVSDSLASPNTANVLSATYSVSGDISAPAVTSLTADGMYTFKVKFSESLASLATSNVVVKKGALTLTTSNVAIDADDPTLYTVTVADYDSTNKVYATGETSVSLAVNVKGYADSVGNVGAEFNGNVTLSKDTAPPTVVNAGLNKGVVVGGANNDQLNIVFNEDLSASYSTDGVLDSKVTVKKDGVVLTTIGTSSVINDTNGKPRVVQINLGADLAQGVYTVDFAAEAVQDLALVKNVALSTTVNYTNSSAVIGATITTPATNVFNVAFAGGVDMSDSATTLANYTLDGAALPAGTTIGFYGNKQAIRITLPGGTVTTTSTALLKISKDVVNKDGVRVLVSANPDVEVTGTVTITDDVKPVLSEAKYYVNASSDTTSALINVKFNENLVTVTDNAATRANLKVTINGVKQTVTAIADGTAGDKYVTLTLSSAVNVNQAATILVLPEDSDNPTILITDVAGNKATANSTVNTSGTSINPSVAADAAAVAADKTALVVGTTGGEAITAAKTNLTGLATTGANASTIGWASANAQVSATGVVTRPAYDPTNATPSVAGNLTATITKGLSSDTRAFGITVLNYTTAATGTGTAINTTVAAAGAGVNISANALTINNDIGGAIAGLTVGTTGLTWTYVSDTLPLGTASITGTTLTIASAAAETGNVVLRATDASGHTFDVTFVVTVS